MLHICYIDIVSNFKTQVVIQPAVSKESWWEVKSFLEAGGQFSYVFRLDSLKVILLLAYLLHIKRVYLDRQEGLQYCYGCIEGFGGDDCILFGQSHLHKYAH